AVIPGRCAAPPAPAMMTLKPAALAPLAKAYSRSGVRWAETIRLSLATPSASSVSAAKRMVSQSDWLPMMMATGAVIQTGSFHESRSIRRIIGLAPSWQGERNGLWFHGQWWTMKKKPKLSAQRTARRRTAGARAGTKPDRAADVKRGKPRPKPARRAAPADPKLTIGRLRSELARAR